MSTDDLFSPNGKTAIITGSTRGIGAAIAEQFGRAGASCVISSEDVEAGKATRPVVDGGTTITDGS